MVRIGQQRGKPVTIGISNEFQDFLEYVQRLQGFYLALCTLPLGAAGVFLTAIRDSNLILVKIFFTISLVLFVLSAFFRLCIFLSTGVNLHRYYLASAREREQADVRLENKKIVYLSVYLMCFGYLFASASVIAAIWE